LIPENHIVRIVDCFVDLLDLSAFKLKYIEPKNIGRKAYPPKMMLKLYLYGYTQKIRSSRNLEKATYENLPFIWLMHELKPDFKTISNFRKDNKGSFKKIFRAFNKYCYNMKLIDLELVAIDGTYLDAVNHNSKNYTKDKLNDLLSAIDKRIDAFLKTMDSQDLVIKDSDLSLEELKAKKDYYQSLINKANETGSTQISLTDPDSKMMRKKASKADVSFNAQLAVDAKNKLIAEQDVTNETNDSHQLAKMSKLTKESYDVDELSVVADKGYGYGKEIKECNESNIKTYVPIQNNEHMKGSAFSTYKFIYDRENDTYTCPNNRILPLRNYHKPKSSKEYGSKKTCIDCEFREDCIGGKKKKYRTISRSNYRDIIEQQEKINNENKEIINLRKSIVEHPFGTIKRTMNQSYFLTKGLEMVKGEFSLTCLAYNLKRTLNILGFDRMIASMKSFFDKETKKLHLLLVNFNIFIRNVINILHIHSKLASSSN
jgi:transposase